MPDSPPLPDDTLRVASWNIERNGRRRGGSGPIDGHDAARDLLAQLRPHVVFRQELSGGEHAESDLRTEAERLGLTGTLAHPHPGRSKHPVGIMVDPRLFEIVDTITHDMPWKPILQLRVRVRGCRKVLDLASAHLTHYDPGLRATEARRLTTLADHQRTVLIGLDANSYPHHASGPALPDWDQIPDPVHHQHRTIERGGAQVSDTRPSEILTGGRRPVFTDLAHHAGTVLGQAAALAPTASLRRTDQGPAQRIDWLLSTPDLAPALEHVEVVASPAVREVSDHALVIARLRFSAVQHALTP